MLILMIAQKSKLKGRNRIRYVLQWNVTQQSKETC